MSRPLFNLHFELMSFTYKIRDILRPRKPILEEVGIKSGFHVLDFGRGPGSYVFPVSGMVGPRGKVYALDRHPLAVASVRKIAARRSLTNVEAVLSDGKIELPDRSLDTILMYDVLHDLQSSGETLAELRRVLKPEGILSLSDHHLKDEEIVTRITTNGMFNLMKRGKWTFSFLKTG